MAFTKSLRNPPPTTTRVEQSTQAEVNRRIQRDTEAGLASAAADRAAIERRLKELDEEWDIERVLQTNFGAVNLAGILLGALVARPFFLLTGVAAVFMGQHALQGWCPPVSVFRRQGFRTANEIAQERHALKALRGDFQKLDNPHQALQATG